VALALVCHACASVPPTHQQPPTLTELQTLTYSGLDDRLGPVTLERGRWMGAPSAPGSASRPTVELADFHIAGDLDGDGIDESVVVLTYSPGGTGVLSYLAVVTRQGRTLHNTTTAALGDRVQIRSVRIAGGQLVVNAVRAGPDDAACCPGDLVDWQWTLGASRLHTTGPVTTGRLSLSTLAGTVWTLRAWDIDEPAEVEPAVTLAYGDGHFTGTSGCNRYTANAVAGTTPGDVSVGLMAGTRMACPEPQSSVETRFVEQLSGARTFGFRLGRLAMSYTRADGVRGTMLFDAATAESTRRH